VAGTPANPRRVLMRMLRKFEVVTPAFPPPNRIPPLRFPHTRLLDLSLLPGPRTALPRAICLVVHERSQYGQIRRSEPINLFWWRTSPTPNQKARIKIAPPSCQNQHLDVASDSAPPIPNAPRYPLIFSLPFPGPRLRFSRRHVKSFRPEPSS